MPFISLSTSLSRIPDKDDLLKRISYTLSDLTGKPESYVMTMLNESVSMTFSGQNDPCCYVEVKSIGSLDPSKITKALCSLIEEMLAIPSDRIYISFEDVPANLWGFNSRTFG